MYFYKPKAEENFAGDVIPFYFNGTFHIFYLLDVNHHQLTGGQHQWAHLSTRDFVTFKEHPLALMLGKEGEADSASCGTGSVFWDGKLFHIFYLGRSYTTKGVQIESICHAVSKDLDVWEKDSDNPVSLPVSGYTRENWRDPFVYEEKGIYHMLVTAEKEKGYENRKAVVAQLVSKDLKRWEIIEDFYAPETEYQHECPDMFYYSGYCYLFYSVGGNKKKVYYRKRKLTEETFHSSYIDYFDGKFLYAAKTVTDGKRIFLIGFVPAKTREKNEGEWLWGGNLCMLELKQKENGDLAPFAIREQLENYDEIASVKEKSTELRANSYNQLTCQTDTFILRSLGTTESKFCATYKVRVNVDTKCIFFYLYSDDNLKNAICYQLNLHVGSVTVEIFENGIIVSKESVNTIFGEDEYILHFFAEDSVVQLIVDGKIVLTDRYYKKGGNNIFLGIEEGNLTIWKCR